MPVAFALRLETDDGSVTEVPVRFDIDALTATERGDAMARWDGLTPSHLAASLLFGRTGLPPAQWEAVGPVLQAVIEGDTTALEVTDGR